MLLRLLPRLTKTLRIPPDLLGGLGRALSQRDYRYYACGHIAQVHGWWGNRLGMGWLTWELTESAAWLGIIGFAGMIPVMVIAPLAGALADRYGHRRMAILAGAAGAVMVAVADILALMGEMTIALLLILNLLQGKIFGIEYPARQALIPSLVGRENISAAIAFNSTTFQVGSFLGPLLAGLFIALWGAGASILISAVSTVWMVVMLAMIRQDRPIAAERKKTGLIADMRAGFVYLRGNASIRLLFLLAFISGVLVRPYNHFLPGFADVVFGRGAEGLAALNAAGGAGALLIAVFLVFRGRTQGLVGIMLAGTGLAALALTLFTATTHFGWALWMLALTAMMLLASQVGWTSLVQNVVDPVMRGRIIAMNVGITIGAPALGTLLLGWLAEALGLRLALGLASVCALCLVIAILPVFRRRATEMEATPET